MSLNSLAHRRGANWLRRWNKRNRQQKKHHSLDGFTRIRLTPYLPSFAKVMVCLVLLCVIIELVACIAIVWAILNPETL